MKFIRLVLFIPILFFVTSCNSTKKINNFKSNIEENLIKKETEKPIIQVILGSTRQKRTSDKIGNIFKNFLSTREDIILEIIDLKDYNLPFLDDEIAPANQTTITDPLIQKWSNSIKSANAFVIIVPTYNFGYPGVLKNALDLLFKEWNNKPVAFVGYSGGDSGGLLAVTQLKEVTLALKMKPIKSNIYIPYAWKAFDKNQNFITPINQKITAMINELIANV